MLRLGRRRKLTDSPISEPGDRMQGDVPGKAAQIKQNISPILPSFVISSVFDDILSCRRNNKATGKMVKIKTRVYPCSGALPVPEHAVELCTIGESSRHP